MNPQDEFEKMDESMLKAFQALRGQEFSKEELNDFHAKVMKRIADRPVPAAGFPYAGFAVAAGFSLAVILGAAFYFYQLKIPRHQEAPVKAEVIRVIPAPEILEPKISVPIPQVTVPISSVLKAVPAEETPAAAPAETPLNSSEDLLSEIEALKELGIWTEEDEEEAGIPVEQAFLELARYAGDLQQPSAALSPSSRT